ncbi:MAG: BON domain-containing protein, partial [Burkholderiales bacterium]|nr:BON domain-containing protein [Burkholderiales bacterium]
QLGWVRMEHINVIVKDGVVHLWGLVETSQEIKAITVAAERVAGTMAVEAHLSQLQPWVYSSE